MCVCDVISVQVWRVSDGACVNTFDAHDGRPWALAVGGDGDRLVTGADDATVVVWKGIHVRFFHFQVFSSV